MFKIMLNSTLEEVKLKNLSCSKNALKYFALMLIASCGSQNPVKEDSITTAKIVVNGSELKKYWEVEKSLNPNYPLPMMRNGVIACVTVAFIVGEDGNVHSAQVARKFPEDTSAFEKAALQAIQGFHYQPSKKNPEKSRVLTSNTFYFLLVKKDMTFKEQEASIKPYCEVDLT